MKVLFVCTGNICRSPLAEGILRKKLTSHNVPAEIDSAGFEAFHAGDPADERALKTALEHGVDISTHTARLLTTSDFQKYDRIYIMDEYHLQRIKQFASSNGDMKKVDFIMNLVHPGQNQEVEDPWYDGLSAFERVYRKLDQACGILAEEIASGKQKAD